MAKLNVCKYFDINYSWAISITIHFLWMGIYNIWIFPMYISCRWAFKHLDIHMFGYWLSMTRYIGHTMNRFQTLKSHLCDRLTDWQSDRVTEWQSDMVTARDAHASKKKTWSKNALNHLKWILKSTCFFTFMRPHSPLLDSPRW